MFEKNQYDMILMDCQMPEMDGFQATQKIRELEQENDVEEGVVILALTANARKEDKDRCLACGMNDYLSKPFTMNQLGNMILKWHSPAETEVAADDDLVSAEVSETESADSRTEESLLDFDTINNIRTLQNPKSPNILGKLLEIYLTNAPELMRQVEPLIRDGNHEAVRECAHSLKSASGSIGARKMFELSAILEGMGRDDDLGDALGILAELKRLFPVTCRLLEQEIQRHAA